MRKLLDRLACATLLLVPGMLLAAESAPARLFGAPEAAASPQAGSATGIGQVTFALLVVLVAVFAVAFVMKRLRGISGGGADGIEVLSQVSLGSRERAVIVRVAGSRLLLGVANGQVRLLHTLPPEPDAGSAPPAPAAPTRPAFLELLNKGLGK